MQHRSLDSVPGNDLYGERSKAVDLCTTDSLCCTPEPNTTVCTSYTPVKW